MKKTVYILLTCFLGIILSFFVHALIEFTFLEYARAHGIRVNWNMDLGASCSLPGFVQYLIIFLGILGGYFLGQYWWRIVYIEKRFKNKVK